MQQTQLLPWISLGLGAAAMAASFARAARGGLRPAPEVRPFFLVAGVAGLMAALFCLPTRGVWSPGQALVPSLLLGGAAVLLGALAAAHPTASREDSREDPAAGTAAAIAAPVVALSILLLLFPRGDFNAMGGYALGALLAGIFVAGGLRLQASGEVGPRVAAAAEMAAVFASALAVATSLAIYHLSPAGAREWMPHPTLFGAVLAAGLAVQSILPPALPGGRLTPLGAVVLPAGLMAWLIGHRLQGSPDFTWAILIGLGVFLVLGLLEALDTETADGAAAAPASRIRMDVGLLAALLTLGGAVLAFRELHGYGIALVAVAGAGVTGALARSRESGLLRGAVVLALLIALYRAFHEAYAFRIRLEFLYEHLGLLLGAFLPALLAGASGSGGQGRGIAPASTSIVRVGMIGLAAAAAPLLVWVLVGSGSQAAFLVGLAIGSGFLLSRATGTGATVGAPDCALAGLLSLGMAHSALQFTLQLQNRLEMLTRTQRIWVLVGAAGAAVLAAGLLAWLDRHAGRPTISKAVEQSA